MGGVRRCVHAYLYLGSFYFVEGPLAPPGAPHPTTTQTITLPNDSTCFPCLAVFRERNIVCDRTIFSPNYLMYSPFCSAVFVPPPTLFFLYFYSKFLPIRKALVLATSHVEGYRYCRYWGWREEKKKERGSDRSAHSPSSISYYVCLGEYPQKTTHLLKFIVYNLFFKHPVKSKNNILFPALLFHRSRSPRIYFSPGPSIGRLRTARADTYIHRTSRKREECGIGKKKKKEN